ncbi:MAG: hypothetical protein HY865_22265 [Chloroflexi bacterium]|nr:hypothetical protein [Chloroflexota bacterium]
MEITTQAYWCAECNRVVEGHEVSFTERHENCGSSVKLRFFYTLPKPVSLPDLAVSSG